MHPGDRDGRALSKISAGLDAQAEKRKQSNPFFAMNKALRGEGQA